MWSGTAEKRFAPAGVQRADNRDPRVFEGGGAHHAFDRTRECLVKGRAVEDAAANERDVRGNEAAVAGRQVVDDSDGVPGVAQCADDVRSDAAAPPVTSQVMACSSFSVLLAYPGPVVSVRGGLQGWERRFGCAGGAAGPG